MPARRVWPSVPLAFPVFGWPVALCLLGCPSKEAEDPRAILGDWTEHGGVDGTRGARGVTEPRSAQGQGASDGLATRADCTAAARRIEELALELAVKDVDDPEARAKLDAQRKAELAGPAFRQRVKEGAEECLSRDTSREEARCISRARSEMDVDRCSSR